jgi:hypothetical protein
MPADVSIVDVAHHLANRCRFGGATRKHYSVAEHCVYVSGVVRRMGGTRFDSLCGLVHDAAEAYLPDVQYPHKREPDFAFFCSIEHANLRVICRALDVEFPFPNDELVDLADKSVCLCEARALLPGGGADWQGCERWRRAADEHCTGLVGRLMEPATPKEAKRLYLDEFAVLHENGRRMVREAYERAGGS